jgi:ribonuclease E
LEGDSQEGILFREIFMARKRLTKETLASVSELAGAREHVRLAESILGPSATDNEILETAHRLSHLRPDQARAINQSRQTILRQNQRIAASPDGAEDPWDESGPDQPDPTNNQAYTKQIMTTPDHAVLDSLQKKEVHAPTASRRARDLSKAARAKYRLAAGDEDEEEEEADRTSYLPSDAGSISADMEDEEEVPDITEDEELDEEELGDRTMDDSEELAEDAHDVMEDEMEDAELGEEELEDLEGAEEDAIDIDEDEGDLDRMLDMEDEELGEEDLGEPDIFDDVDRFDDADETAFLGQDSAGLQGSPMSSRQRRPASRQAGRGRRMVAGARQPQNSKLKTGASGGSGPARMSLDEILDVHDEDIERTASTPLEGDDLEALLGARVDRAGRRVATTKRPERESPAAQQRRAMLENVWDTENEPEIIQARGGQSSVRRQAAKRSKPVQSPSARGRGLKQQQFAPDRRRTTQRSADNEFDQVFGVDGMPDVSKFFD